MIPASRLSEFLEKGYEKFLPDDGVPGAQADMDQLVKDFVEYRKRVEA